MKIYINQLRWIFSSDEVNIDIVSREIMNDLKFEFRKNTLIKYRSNPNDYKKMLVKTAFIFQTWLNTFSENYETAPEPDSIEMINGEDILNLIYHSTVTAYKVEAETGYARSNITKLRNKSEVTLDELQMSLGNALLLQRWINENKETFLDSLK